MEVAVATRKGLVIADTTARTGRLKPFGRLSGTYCVGPVLVQRYDYLNPQYRRPVRYRSLSQR